jgi:hypothetical protein
MPDLDKTASMRMHMIEARVVHLYPLPGRPAVLVSYTLRYDDVEEQWPGCVVLPLARVEQLRLQPGDELHLLTQKTRSQHHEARR